MRKSSLVSLVAPWVGFAAVVAGAGTLWHRGAPPAQKPAVSSEELAEEAGLQPRRLIVDFRDDISPAALAATGFHEVPVSAYSAVDGLYQIDFASADEAAAARAKLARDPDVESVDYDALATIPPDEEARKCWPTRSRRARWRPSAAGPAPATRRLPQRRLLQVPVAHAPDRHAEPPGSRGTARASVVAVIDTGVDQGRRPRRHQVRRRLQLRRQQRQRRRRPRPRHARRRHHRAVDQQRLGVAGVAYGATIMPLKVLSAQGSGSVARHRRRDPLGRRPRRQRHQHEPGRRGARSARMEKAVKYAHDKGVVVVVRRRQRRARPGRLPGRATRAPSPSRRPSTTRRPPSTRTAARRSTSPRRAATRASTRTATAGRTASCRTPS